jgi:hypothetical protein
MKYEENTKSGFDRKEHRDRRGGLPCFVLFVFFAVNSICSAQIQQAWVARYNNGITNGTHQAVKMALDTNGNVYVTGFSQNTNGNLGYATIKYAPNGTQIWVARYDSTNYPSAQPTGLALDHQSNTVVTGSAVTVKYNCNGNPLWTLQYSGAGVAVDSSNNVCITGVASNYTTMKFDPAGSNLWSQTFTSAGPCGAQTINISASDDIYVCGYEFYIYLPGDHGVAWTAIKYDSVGTQLWRIDTSGQGTHGYVTVQSANVDNAGNLFLIINGDTSGFDTGAFSSGGGVLWAAPRPNTSAGDLGRGLALDSSNEVIVTGKIQDTIDYNSSYGTYKINTNGAYVWTNLYPQAPTTTNVATAIAVDQWNQVYVTGYSPGTNSGNDIVTIKYDNNGNQIWLERYNGPGNGDDEGNAIAVDANGNVYVAGYETTAAGGTEFVTIKYAPGPFLKKEANGSFLLQAVGAAGENFDFQASTNLVNWQDLGTNTADSNGLVQFLDTNAPLYPYRFYLTNPR